MSHLQDTLFKKYKIDLRCYPAVSHKSLCLVKWRMRQIYDYIGKLNLSNSKMNIHDFSSHINIVQSHNNTLPYGIANINDVQVCKIVKWLKTLALMIGLCFKYLKVLTLHM